MPKEPLFFKDEGAMGDVFEAAKQIVEQTRLSRENRSRVTAITEERMKKLTGKFVDYDTVNARHNEYKIKVHQLRVQLLRSELSPDDAKKALEALAGEREALKTRYAELVSVLDQQMKDIDAELETLKAREVILERQKNQYHSALHMEVQWLAEGELKEIAALKEDLKKKRDSLVEEKTLIFNRTAELAESFSLVEDVFGQKQTRYVPAENARASELNFLARFDMKMNAFPVKLFSPNEGMTYTVTNWKSHYHYDAGQTQQAKDAGGKIIPMNAGSVYAVEQKDISSIIGRTHRKVVAEAFSLCNLADYSDLGFDTRPVTLPGLMGVLNPIIQKAEAGDYFHMVGVASPTGWDEGAIGWVTGSSGSNAYVSRNVAVCRIDSVLHEVYYNKNDNRIASYVDYFRHDFDRERVGKMKDVIRAEWETAEYLEFEKIFEKTKEERFIIQMAFAELEREKVGRTKFVEGVGMVFMR
ncbi:MAG: hypothetical protein GYA23_13695 [Methanomicrobiales archaeon]|nr:hypothetical protein [Methanomicrobiales archaeon]